MISFGYCTQIGIDSFTGFATQPTKSRLNFLYLLRAGQGGYVVNSAALYYMRRRALAGPLIERPACAPTTRLVDHADWQAHLRHLGIEELAVPQHPAGIATDGAICGAISAHGMHPAQRMPTGWSISSRPSPPPTAPPKRACAR